MVPAKSAIAYCKKKTSGIHLSNITVHFQNKMAVVRIAISEHIVIFT